MKKIASFASLALLFFVVACTNNDATPDPETTIPSTPVLSYSIAGTQPHDTSYFLEGIEFYNGTLIESTGLQGKSKLVQKQFPAGKLLKEVKLDAQYFGEGVSILHDTAYQLTYQEHKVFVYDAKTFTRIKELPLNTEGWGLTNDGKQLIASDGTSNLYFYEPGTFRLLRTQGITENGSPVVNINELEYINGFIYANQWQYNYILKIDPASGTVVGKMDFTNTINQVKSKYPFAEFFNGIAYNPQTKKLYVTGKYWPELFEVKVAL